MQIFIYCKATPHVSCVTAPIVRSIKNCTRNLRYRSYYLYRYSPPRWRGVAVFIYCKATLHVSGVTAPIIRSIKNCTRNLQYRSYYLYRRLRVQFLILLMMGAVTPETCRVVLQWINICILLHLLFFYSHGPGISVGIATDNGQGGPGSNPGGDEIFRPSRPALGPTQPPVQWVPGLSRGLKCGRGVLLTTHPLLVPRSWQSRAIPLPTLWATLGL